MVHVVLDTNIFRHDPTRNKVSFRALSKLSKSGFAKIYIPYIVYKEFLSQEIKEYLDNFEKLKKGIKYLQRKFLSQEMIDQLEDIDQKVDHLKSALDANVETIFKKWIDDNNAELLPIKNHHGENVINAYFEGEKPFASKKSKKDIPDAFIWEAIRDLLNDVDHLYVISNDAGIIKACENHDKITNYQNLDDFITSDLCHEKLRDIYFEEKLPEIILILKTKMPSFKEQLDQSFLEKLPGYVFKDYNILDDNNEATIYSVGAVENLEINFDETEYYGEGFLVILFNCNIEVYANYYIFKSDYYTLSDEETQRIGISDHNDHYYEADETFELEIGGTLSVIFDISEIKNSDQIISEFDKLFENATIDIEDFKVSSLPREEY